MGIGTISITKVMTLIDHNKIIVTPVDPVDWQSDWCHAAISGKIRMVEDIIAEPISSQRVVYQIPAIGHPVLRELLWAEDKYVLIPAFVIFDDRKRSESFTKTDTVRQNAAVILLQLIDDFKSSILLEIVELIPDHAVLESGRFIWQDIF